MSQRPAGPLLWDRIETRTLARFGRARTAVLLIIAAMLIWPIIEVLGAVVITAFPPLELVWLRYAVHLSLLLLFTASGSRSTLFRTQFVGLHLGRSLLMLGMPVFWLLAAARMPGSTLMAFFWTAPIVAIIGAWVLLRDRPSLADTVLTAAGFVGTLLLLRPELPRGLRGPICALAMSGCYALYLVATRWMRREPTSVNLVYSALGVFVALCPVMPFIWRQPPLSAVPVIILVGALGLVLLFLIDRALHHATVARTASLGFLQPASELLVFGSSAALLAPRTARAGLLIILCVVAVSVLRSPDGAPQTPNELHD